MSETVLVPLDGSPQAENALEYALDDLDADVTAITVIDPFDVDPLTIGYQSPTGVPGMPGYSEEWYQGARDRAKGILEAAREAGAERGTEIATAIEIGRPARVIVRYAEEHDIDHIVLGSHGRSRLSRVLIGSVAETIARRSPTSVSIIR